MKEEPRFNTPLFAFLTCDLLLLSLRVAIFVSTPITQQNNPRYVPPRFRNQYQNLAEKTQQ